MLPLIYHLKLYQELLKTRTWKTEKPNANVSDNYDLWQRSIWTKQSQHQKQSCSDVIF